LILVEPTEEKTGRKIELDSNVKYQYGDKILNLIKESLDFYEIEDIHLIAKDKGALEPTIKARLETVMQRALNQQKGVFNG
jgi:citrate lyase subunit gamma (acyl carrier protein)